MANFIQIVVLFMAAFKVGMSSNISQEALKEYAENVYLADAERESRSLDLKTIVKDLDRAGKFIRVAFNGINAAGPKFQDLTNKVQRLSFGISKLCDKTSLTISSFRMTSKTITEELMSMLWFLKNNKEYMVIDIMAGFSDLAREMAEAAEELEKELEKQDNEVIETLELTQGRRATEEVHVRGFESKRQELKKKEELENERIRDLYRKEETIREKRFKYEADEENEHSKSFFWRNIGNAILSFVRVSSIFDTEEDSFRRADRWRKESIELLEIEKELHKLRYDALEKMTQYITDLQNIGNQEKVADASVSALHQASGALRQLSLMMRRAAVFWKTLQQHSKSLASNRVKRNLENLERNCSAEERMEFLNSSRFTNDFRTYYTRWVFLHKVSDKYLKHVELTRKELYQYIEENPTHEESRANLVKLIRDLQDDLKREKIDMEQKDSLVNEELNKLKEKDKKEEL